MAACKCAVRINHVGGYKAASDVEEAFAEDSASAEAERFFQFIREQTEELKMAGMTEGRARGTATLEHRIAQWPSAWGNELRIIIYGDFQPPSADLHFPELGIVVESGAVKASIVRSAMCVVNARVTVSEKTIAGLADASARINTLLGVSAVSDWGNSGNGWWCHVTHGSMAGHNARFDQYGLERAINALALLPPVVRRKVNSALYWIREPRQMMMEGYRNDILRVYAGYWNAFECLVEAICILRPQRKLSRKEKQEKIDQIVAYHNRKVDLACISECYRSAVDPGFVAKATHALRQCFPDHADRYVEECFRPNPEEDRLYNIRNAINHGDIEAEDFGELIRIEDKHRRLWMIVFGMLGQIIPIPRPVDADLN